MVTQSELEKHLESLKDSNKNVRWSAADALGKIGPDAKAAVAGLIKALEDNDNNVRIKVIEALGEIGPGASEAVPGLIVTLKDPDKVICWTAIEALGKIGRVAVHDLLAALKDKDENLQLAIAMALGRIASNAEDVVPVLFERINDRETGWIAATALSMVNDNTVMAALIEGLSDKNEATRQRSARLLSEISTAAAAPAFIEALKINDDSIRASIVSKLVDISIRIAEASKSNDVNNQE